jgi:hypothetical protein
MPLNDKKHPCRCLSSYMTDLMPYGGSRHKLLVYCHKHIGSMLALAIAVKVDAERFLSASRTPSCAAPTSTRPPVGCRSVSGPSGGSGRRQPCARARARTRPVGQASSQGPPDPVADPSERCGRRAASPQRARGHQAPQGPAQGDVLPDRRPGGRWASGVGGVKTHGARTVRLPRSLAEELDAYLAGRLNGREDLVFTAPRGGRCGSRSSCPNELAKDGRPHPLPGELRLYDLRHTAASLMIRQGASIKAVQKQLGHATASITLDTYGHLCSPTSWRPSPAAWRTPAPKPWPPWHGPSADQRSCLSGKALVSERVRGCRRRGSNPHALWAQRF